MAHDERCPRCGKELLIQGSFETRGWVGVQPKELRPFSLSLQFSEVSLCSEPTACASCGLVWAELDPSQLRLKLDDLGNDDVRRRLGLLDEKEKP